MCLLLWICDQKEMDSIFPQILQSRPSNIEVYNHCCLLMRNHILTWTIFCRLTVACKLTYLYIEPRSCRCDFRHQAKSSTGGTVDKYKPDALFIDKHGRWRSFTRKKLSRKRCNAKYCALWCVLICMSLCRCLHKNCKEGTIVNIWSQHIFAGGSLRGKGWKYGSGFVDGIFPVLSPIAQQILNFIQKEVDPNIVGAALDTLPATHAMWDDLINVAVQLRFNKQWDLIILVRNSIDFSFWFYNSW